MKETPVEATIDFANDWISYRANSAGCHEVLLYPRLLAHLGNLEGLVVADLGCGDGTFGKTILQQNPSHFIAIDINPVLVKIASQHLGANTSAVVSDIGTLLPFDSNKLDRIVCSCAVMHLAPGQFETLLDEVYRSLKPEGEAVFSVIHQEWVAKYPDISPIDCHTSLFERHLEHATIKEFHRNEDFIIGAFRKAEFIIRDFESIVIPNDLTLPYRYSSQSGSKLFEVFKLSK